MTDTSEWAFTVGLERPGDDGPDVLQPEEPQRMPHPAG
jgi:hypothetical protein